MGGLSHPRALWWLNLLPHLHKGSIHHDVIKWKHIPCCCPFVRRIHGSRVDSPHIGHWRGPLIFSLICTSTNRWANNWDAGDLRPNFAHCDITVMQILATFICGNWMLSSLRTQQFNQQIHVYCPLQKYSCVMQNLCYVLFNEQSHFNIQLGWEIFIQCIFQTFTITDRSKNGAMHTVCFDPQCKAVDTLWHANISRVQICTYMLYIYCRVLRFLFFSDVIMSAMASQITGVSIVCSTVYSGPD